MDRTHQSSPRVSGFTFIKNGITLGYPIVESIKSIEPFCDEVIINIGYDDPNCQLDDGTSALLQSTFNSAKFKFLHSWWNPEMNKQGLILSQQTNLAMAACRGEVGFYIQGDEVVHEEDGPEIRRAIELLCEHPARLDGIIFNYLHFYGNVDIIKYTRKSYRREVRLIRLRPDLKSHLDAQGFRFTNGKKPRSVLSSARIFHYGWARREQVMHKKVVVMDGLYHGSEAQWKAKVQAQQAPQAPSFTYNSMWGLRPFRQTHPALMQEWIARHRNEFNLAEHPYKFRWRDSVMILCDAFEAVTGIRPGEFKNYKRV